MMKIDGNVKIIDFEYNGFYMAKRKTITGTPGFIFPDSILV